MENHDPFIGMVLISEYIIQEKFSDDGSYGVIYIVKSLESNKIFLVKIGEEANMNFKEHQILAILNKEPGQTYFPKIHGGGTFELEDGHQKSFIIIEMLGKTLQHYFFKRSRGFTIKTVCQIGIQLIEALERLHSIGFIHGDLKLENILVGDMNHENLSEIKLIDFGLSSSFVDEQGNHIQFKNQEFQGNLAFCSKWAITNCVQGRRDDLMSLLFLMLYILKGSLSFLGIKQDTDGFEQIAQKKYISTAESVCRKKANVFLKFASKIYDLKFEEEPHYESLKEELQRIIIQDGGEYDKVFDWNTDEIPEIILEISRTSNMVPPISLDEFKVIHLKIQEKLEEIKNISIGKSDKQPNDLFNHVVAAESGFLGLP